MTDTPDRQLFTFSRQANYWNDFYERPASLFEHVMVKRRDYALKYIRSHFHTRARILDLGCGAGVLSEKLIESGFAVTAADASPDMLALCRERLQALPAACYRLVHADCLSLPFPAGEFDLVVCLGVFGYFDEVSLALREIHRVLRPGGTLFMSVRNAHTRYIFDLVHLAALPLHLVRKLAGRLLDRVRAARRRQAIPVRQGSADDGFRIRIHHNPARLIAGVSRRGYTLTEFDGLGYGPLAFAGRALLPARVAVRLSDGLERAFRKTGLNRLSRWIADVSFFIFRRRE